MAIFGALRKGRPKNFQHCEGQKVPQSQNPQKFKVTKKSNEKVTLGVDPKVKKKQLKSN